jgi:hypothetical protein
VVAGSAGAEGFVSAPGVDCSGGVACAICGPGVEIRANERPDTASPDATNVHARSISSL